MTARRARGIGRVTTGFFAAAEQPQLQLLLDCCDGEVARWRRTFSPKGPYLDALAHYSTEAALPAALGIPYVRGERGR